MRKIFGIWSKRSKNSGKLKRLVLTVAAPSCEDRGDELGAWFEKMTNHVYLVAEDDDNTRMLLKRAFLKAGFDFPIYWVKDGQETIDYLKGFGKYANRTEFPFPAILLLDYNMPKLDGLAVLKTIRADPGLKTLIVVILSSSIDEAQILTTYAAGANSYVEKPFEFSELVEAVSCINYYWFGCNHFPVADGTLQVVRPQKKHRLSRYISKETWWDGVLRGICAIFWNQGESPGDIL
jgi:two-component system response regulator